MTSQILLEGRVSLFPLFPPVDKFAEQNNPRDQKHPNQISHGPPPIDLSLFE
jgi:hypothetical protein